MLSRVRPSLTVNPLKRVRFAAPKKATTRGKKIWGRKRHLLVDTQGNLLVVKVTGAHHSDQQGAKTLLEPVKELFPSIKLLWGDSHYGGTLIGWRKRAPGLGRGHCAPSEGARTRSARARRHRGGVGKTLSLRLSSAAQKMGGRTQLCLDHQVASVGSRS